MSSVKRQRTTPCRVSTDIMGLVSKCFWPHAAAASRSLHKSLDFSMTSIALSSHPLPLSIDSRHCAHLQPGSTIMLCPRAPLRRVSCPLSDKLSVLKNNSKHHPDKCADRAALPTAFASSRARIGSCWRLSASAKQAQIVRAAQEISTWIQPLSK